MRSYSPMIVGYIFLMASGSSVPVLYTEVTTGADGLLPLPASTSPDELIITKGNPSPFSPLSLPLPCFRHNLPDQRLFQRECRRFRIKFPWQVEPVRDATDADRCSISWSRHQRGSVTQHKESQQQIQLKYYFNRVNKNTIVIESLQ